MDVEYEYSDVIIGVNNQDHIWKRGIEWNQAINTTSCKLSIHTMATEQCTIGISICQVRK